MNAKLQVLKDCGLLPKEASGLMHKTYDNISIRNLGARGVARAELLLYWMHHQNKNEGIVDLCKEKDVVHVGGTFPDTRGKTLYINTSKKLAVLLRPCEILSSYGYTSEAHNVAVAPMSVVEGVLGNILPFNLVFVSIWACRLSLV